MMRTTLAAGLLTALLWLPAAGAAAVTEDQFQIHTTGDLAALCAADPGERLGTPALNFCEGYATGAYQVLEQEQAAPRSTKLFCMPQPAPTRTEAMAAFVQWARADQAHQALPPADGVAEFLTQTYPCHAAKR